MIGFSKDLTIRGRSYIKSYDREGVGVGKIMTMAEGGLKTSNVIDKLCKKGEELGQIY